MTDTTNPIPPISQPVIDRYRKWDSVWYRFLKPLFETVRSTNRSVTELTTTVAGNTTTITELTESVDGISAQWAVTINSNGRVTGLVRLDSGATGSTFSVLADKFIVYNPANDGQSLQAFIIGSINGTSTVGINGNLVVDDTILARHIAVSELSAITADIGTVTAGVVQSANGKVVLDLDNGTFTITS